MHLYKSINKAAIWGLIFILLLSACKQPVKQAPAVTNPVQSSQNEVTKSTISNNYGLQFIDTTIAMELSYNDKKYTLMLKDIPAEEPENNMPVCYLQITENATNHAILSGYYNFNATDGLYHPVADTYWLGLISSGGGSGYRGTLYNIRIADTAILQPILSFGELTHWKSNRDGSSIIVIDGIWDLANPDAEKFESHFGQHIHSINVYTIQKDSILRLDLGLTQNKYSSEYETSELLNAIKLNEPQLFGKIIWQDYE